MSEKNIVDQKPTFNNLSKMKTLSSIDQVFNSYFLIKNIKKDIR